jgi:hypothetical protein
MVFAFAAPTLNLDTKRRNCPSSVALAILVAFAGLPVVAGAEVVDLRGVDSADSHQQVRVVVEVEGKLKVNLDGKAVQHVPMKATAELQYVERTLLAGKAGSGGRAVRHYEKADAQIRLRETDLTNTLRPERRIIVLDAQGAEPTQFSPLGPLTREELELIEVPASAISLTALLPEQPLAIGGEWKLSDKVISRLFNLEAVSQQTVIGKLDSVKDGIAIASLKHYRERSRGQQHLEIKASSISISSGGPSRLTLAIQEKAGHQLYSIDFEVVDCGWCHRPPPLVSTSPHRPADRCQRTIVDRLTWKRRQTRTIAAGA